MLQNAGNVFWEAQISKFFQKLAPLLRGFSFSTYSKAFATYLKSYWKPWSCCNLTNFCFVTFFSAWLFCSTVKVFWSTSFTKNTSRCSAWFYVLTNWQQHIFIDTDIKFQLQNYWEQLATKKAKQKNRNCWLIRKHPYSIFFPSGRMR